jgi:hypothetical protein
MDGGVMPTGMLRHPLFVRCQEVTVMAKVEIPCTILAEMQNDGLIPHVVLDLDHSKSQAVEVSLTMEEWCLQRAIAILKETQQRPTDASNDLETIAGAIHLALNPPA